MKYVGNIKNIAQMYASKLGKPVTYYTIEVKLPSYSDFDDGRESRLADELWSRVDKADETFAADWGFQRELKNVDGERNLHFVSRIFFIQNFIKRWSGDLLDVCNDTELVLMNENIDEALDLMNDVLNEIKDITGITHCHAELKSSEVKKPKKVEDVYDEYGNKWELGDIVLYSAYTPVYRVICGLTPSKILLDDDGSYLNQASCALVSKRNGTPVKFGTLFG